MPVPSLITDLSTTAGSNSPAGSDNVFPDLDNHLRAISAFIASIRDNSGNGWVSPYLPTSNAAMTGTPTAPTATSGTNTTQVATTAFVQTALRTLYPVGSVYINATNATNPGTLLGFGTWVAFGAGRVPVGFDAGNALFDTAEETGGSADAIAVAHTHTWSGSATTGLESQGHTHSFSGTTAGAGGHSHTVSIPINDGSGPNAYVGGSGTTSNVFNTSSVGDHSHTYSGTTSAVSANHTHSVSMSGTTGSTGSSGTNANYQPYITVYMWKRTA